MEDYIQTHHLGILFIKDSIYAIDPSKESNDGIQKLATKIQENNTLNIATNGLNACTNKMRKMCMRNPKNDNNIDFTNIKPFLPHTFREKQGKGRALAFDAYQKLLNEIFNTIEANRGKVLLNSNPINIGGYSNGNFIITDLAKFIINERRLRVNNVLFNDPPAHFYGFNLGIRNIKNVMNEIQDKGKNKKY